MGGGINKYDHPSYGHYYCYYYYHGWIRRSMMNLSENVHRFGDLEYRTSGTSNED